MMIPEITFDKNLEEYIIANYKSHKVINITDMNNKKIKNLKKNIKVKTILIKFHKDNKDICSIYTNNFTFQIINNMNFKNIVNRLLDNEFKCCICFDIPTDKSSFYICDNCNGIICKYCLNEMYLKKTPDCACCVNGHNEIKCPVCIIKIENKVKHMLVEYIGFCYYPNFSIFCVVYKRDNIEIVNDVEENKIFCFVYSGIASDFKILRYKDIEKINFEQIIKEQNPKTKKKSYSFNLEE